MKKKIGVLLVLITGLVVCLAGCKKKPEEIKEIDRTFEYTEEETTEAVTETEKETVSKTEETTSVEETTKQEETTTVVEVTTEEVTTEESIMTYFGNPDSVFSTLPLFDKGVFSDYFNKEYVEGIMISEVTEAEYTAYIDTVLSAGRYALNSKESNRAYFADADNMCVTLIYHEETMLVEMGKGYWDILTYAEEKATEPTKPVETADARYGYFDNTDMIFSGLPYFTVGVFAGYEVVDKGGKLTFSEVTQDDVNNYGDTLMDNGFMMGGNVESVTYFVTDGLLVSLSFDNGNCVIVVTEN